MSRDKLVRDTAYAIWEAEGRPEGREAEHWRLAEERVARGEAADAKPKAATTARGRGKTKPGGAPAPTRSRSKKAG